jgi:hypothetical protein
MIALTLTEDEVSDLKFALSRCNNYWFDDVEKYGVDNPPKRATYFRLIHKNHQLWDKLHAATGQEPLGIGLDAISGGEITSDA